MYSIYETRLDEAREEIADLVHKIISSSQKTYTIADFDKFKSELLRLKKEYKEGLKEALALNCDQNTTRIFSELQEFYKKNMDDIENTHLKTLESSKVHFK